jgi:hypothetical protein
MTEFISASEYARRKGVGPSRIRVLVKEGRLPNFSDQPGKYAIPADMLPGRSRKLGTLPEWAKKEVN